MTEPLEPQRTQGSAYPPYRPATPGPGHDTVPVRVHTPSGYGRTQSARDYRHTGQPQGWPSYPGPGPAANEATAPRAPQQLADWTDRPTSTGRHVARGLRGLLETIVPAIIIALLINLFVAQATRVYGLSMEPNLHTEQRLVVEKISYNSWLRLRSPQRGDVVVLRINGADELLIKRVIGLPGDQIEIRGGQVLVNHVPLDEPYIALPVSGDYSRMDVPPLHLFVLGDNRNFSNDSRTFGPIPMKAVVGRAWFSYWPPESWGPVR